MSSGNHLNRGRTPAPISAYLRDLAGWTNNTVILNYPGEYQANHGDYGTLFRYETDNPNEYFLIENRSSIGIDSHCPSSGLAIYHCDTLGSNEWQDGTATRHYQCALIQADGRRDLENDRNRGDSEDLFCEKSGLVLSSDTIPNSRAWGGIESGLNLFDISRPGATISFKTGVPDINIPVVQKESIANELIPDNDPSGISNSIIVERSGKIKNIEIGIDINHPYISDLVVEIKAPSGDIIVLHKEEGGDGDDIIKSYTSQDNTNLASLIGKPMEGEWTLSVKDLVSRDAGRLNNWKIKVDYESDSKVIKGEESPDLKIPDNNAQGVVSTINIGQAGVAKNILVSVDITHTYIGDLQLDLIAPSGQKATLFRFGEGQNQKDIKRTFDSSSVPTLSLLTSLNQQVEGDWKLHIVDNAAIDTGILNKWSLELIC